MKETARKTEERAALLEKVGTRQRPQVYIVQTCDFRILPVRSGSKVNRLQRFQVTEGHTGIILSILAGPLYFDSDSEKLEAMRIAQENKARWPKEVIAGEMPVSLGWYVEPEKTTPYDDSPEDGEDWGD